MLELALETILYVLLRDVTYYMHRIKRRGTQTIYRYRMYLVLSVSSLVPSINYVTLKGPQHQGWRKQFSIGPAWAWP